MGIFAFLFLILPLIIIFILALLAIKGLSYILRLFGFSSTPFQSGYGQDGQQNNNRRQGYTDQATTTSEKSPKIIGDDEGEYVDFEEVK